MEYPNSTLLKSSIDLGWSFLSAVLRNHHPYEGPGAAAPPDAEVGIVVRGSDEALTYKVVHGEIDVRDSRFATIEQAIREMRAGRMIVVVDDEHRENEGDLIMAAEKVTPDAINFMITHGRGLVCLAMTGDRLDELELGPMVPDSSALGGTAFTASIDARAQGMTTGISAHERARTIMAAVDPCSKAGDFARPGHVFPLRARPGGVLERRGHTEAAVDLARLAGSFPAGVICEIVNDDGTMARARDLVRFCGKHGLMMITVADLA
jgi:3,4-dihydroxy 2-butanone 4-phosphate synthase / GTP cyclohydrolase II